MASARQKYIEQHKGLAVDTSKGTGLFPSVFLAQAIVESGNGESELAKKYNNHFGIKADKSWKGKKVNMDTREVVGGQEEMQGAWFRVYDSAKESYRDRVKFLTENKRYKNAGVFDAKTPMEQLKALKSAGYATDPRYAEIINDVLEKEKLGTLDQLLKKGYEWGAGHKGVVALIVILVVISVLMILYRKKIAVALDK